MEPNKQGDAASSKPAPNLDARFNAMRHGDPSWWWQQAPYPPAQTATLAVRPPPELPPPPPRNLPSPPFLGLPPPPSPPEEVRQYWPQIPQSQPQLLGYGEGESSAGAGCVWPGGARSYNSIFAPPYGDKQSPRFNARAAPFLSKMPNPSRLSASAEAFPPVPEPNMPSGSAENFQNIPQFHPSMGQSSWRPISSARQYLPQFGAATTSFSGRHDNAVLDPYMSGLAVPHANLVASQFGGRPPTTGRLQRRDEDAQARFPWAPRNPASVMSVGAAERGEEMRQRMLDDVRRAMLTFMERGMGHVVFLELLGRYEHRFVELHGMFDDDERHGIALAACNGDGSLMRVANEVQGVIALKELIRVAAQYPLLSQSLIKRLLREQLMQHNEGAQLLSHYFTTLPGGRDFSFIIGFAIANVNCILLSEGGLRCLVECFNNARKDELRDLERFVLSNTHALAKGRYSNYFLQHVLKSGSEELQLDIVKRVVHRIVELSNDRFGTYVVQACIQLTRSLKPLQHMLNALLSLNNGAFARLVEGSTSNYVVQKLLQAGNTHFQGAAQELARRIVKLPQMNMHVNLMKLAMEILPD